MSRHPNFGANDWQSLGNKPWMVELLQATAAPALRVLEELPGSSGSQAVAMAGALAGLVLVQVLHIGGGGGEG